MSCIWGKRTYFLLKQKTLGWYWLKLPSPTLSNLWCWSYIKTKTILDLMLVIVWAFALNLISNIFCLWEILANWVLNLFGDFGIIMVCKIRCAKFRVEHFFYCLSATPQILCLYNFFLGRYVVPFNCNEMPGDFFQCSLLKALSASQQGNFDTENFFGGMILCNPSLSFMGGTVTNTPCT